MGFRWRTAAEKPLSVNNVNNCSPSRLLVKITEIPNIVILTIAVILVISSEIKLNQQSSMNNY